jgi:hypothetical protein
MSGRGFWDQNEASAEILGKLCAEKKLQSGTLKNYNFVNGILNVRGAIFEGSLVIN